MAHTYCNGPRSAPSEPTFISNESLTTKDICKSLNEKCFKNIGFDIKGKMPSKKSLSSIDNNQIEQIIRPFPERTRHGDLYYDELDDFNKNIVLRHLKIAGKIAMWVNIRKFLKDQIHHKKSKSTKNKSYYPVNSITRHYYTNYIFLGKKNITSWDYFPSQFNSKMENIMIEEMTTKNFNYIPIYYCLEDKPSELHFSDFDENEWVLSEGLEMSRNDIQIVEKYKILFVDFWDLCIRMMGKHNTRESLSKIKIHYS